ncbi:hypothetical protein CDG81_06535 [Actinopolyspora erythraea]|uniref:Uncharacterized protein n=1 Tax=Actinopolyspora erythraea TaxID=414996 RepID=A0A099D149_9ACTN|nr:hypothetical protein CDG81_06535 [Actinopolyspora erythraea]KGI79789.1 hypothetical protein IL38_21570 [Actinopolyspora erythraea]
MLALGFLPLVVTPERFGKPVGQSDGAVVRAGLHTDRDQPAVVPLRAVPGVLGAPLLEGAGQVMRGTPGETATESSPSTDSSRNRRGGD